MTIESVTPAAPSPAELPDSPAGRPPVSADEDAVTAVRRRIAQGLYVPGTRLTLTELRGATGHPASTLRPALDRLAGERLVSGRWRVRDDRPADHDVHRTRRLLKAMIDHGAYPPGTALPTRTDLAPRLLAAPAALSSALNLLADEGVIHLSGNARPRTLRHRHSAPSRGAWPEGAAEGLQALSKRAGSGASLDRATIRLLRATARERWRSGVCLPANVTAEQESRQEGIARHLVLSAYQRCADPIGVNPGVRSAAARVMACAALPTDAVPHERLFRFTVLAIALSDLSDELVLCSSRYGSRGGS